MPDVRQRLQEVFQQVFEDPDLVLKEDMTAADVDGWDSLTHVNLIVAMERALHIRFATAEMSRLKEPDQNIGSLLRMVANKLGTASV